MRIRPPRAQLKLTSSSSFHLPKLQLLNLCGMQKFLKLFGDDRRSVFWITDEANIRADFFKADTFEAGAIARFRSASAAKSDDWSAGKYRSDVNLHLIDEP